MNSDLFSFLFLVFVMYCFSFVLVYSYCLKYHYIHIYISSVVIEMLLKQKTLIGLLRF